MRADNVVPAVPRQEPPVAARTSRQVHGVLSPSLPVPSNVAPYHGSVVFHGISGHMLESRFTLIHPGTLRVKPPTGLT